jgi:hypothetical protein
LLRVFPSEEDVHERVVTIEDAISEGSDESARPTKLTARALRDALEVIRGRSLGFEEQQGQPRGGGGAADTGVTMDQQSPELIGVEGTQPGEKGLEVLFGGAVGKFGVVDVFEEENEVIVRRNRVGAKTGEVGVWILNRDQVGDSLLASGVSLQTAGES